MASLRSTALAARLVRSAHPRIIPAARRFQSNSSSGGELATQDSTLDLEAHKGDHTVTVDKATSNFSSVPKHVQDGSEDVLPAGLLSGAPIDLQARTVRIYQPAKPATQSGEQSGSRWRMDWDVMPKGHRWENQLMGWQSSADAMQGTHIYFKSKEDAINFAEKQGYEYFVQEPNQRAFTPKAYANNFLYTANKLKIVRTK
ncbi:ETC complex I subunit conserved region-domain-containing protein [Podospora aff. communis PSN243]|uniref:NADH dehydrogenase [ubiquinone] iron-sulfur protein 4, mitochondrial n=1 Tax=Podospora aff. communis PSN243 TaxID=3040156 RepID=A0AAV9GP58_9PEZI|nr:ETC complex I subunit conserved region-domain-containing protein [Podospora aff. communis PSN243]